MTWKHEHAFLPALIDEFQLLEWADSVSESWFRINLYSETRGINRFMGFHKCLQELWDLKDRRLRGQLGQDPNELRPILGDPAMCNTGSIKAAISAGPVPPLLPRALSWSKRVTAILEDSHVVHKTFPTAVEVLQKLANRGEVNVISQAPHDTLAVEWKQANLTRFTSRILGQEFGSKVEQARSVAGQSIPECLLVGDAPGDAAAARELGCHFYLIRPGDEEAAWRELLKLIG